METTSEWLQNRKKYLGGTDCAAILGMSRYKTPLEVWAEKTGQIEPKDISDKICIKVGNELEGFVARLFCEETGKKVRRVNETIFHKDYEFIGANIDRRIVGEDTILECKTASAFKSKEWEEEEIPQEYILQCLHYLAVTGKDKIYIAVLIGNQDFKWKEITRKDNEETIDKIIKKEVEFWNAFIIPKIMPGQILRQDSDTLFELYSDSKETEIILDDKANKLIESIDSLKQDIKSTEATLEMQQNELKAMLKENIFGKTNLYSISWKPQTSRRIDTKKLKEERPEIYSAFSNETQSRVLRTKKIAEENNG